MIDAFFHIRSLTASMPGWRRMLEHLGAVLIDERPSKASGLEHTMYYKYSFGGKDYFLYYEWAKMGQQVLVLHCPSMDRIYRQVIA